ncbi:hypothetical protein WEN_00495 [Mycoplasma wenyonii str. Massachusetts]|uniref:Uncharacterized protein n=1 Tax=Mycoplasma wenyonii (strain Massachusetts) TaxID=1197325 RepID=I6YAD3_MYCWM|nr:hypothetical protein [Mycoplasma wenyonii]AFN64906.1 hypothetical protein WEN_00495 [Mycoplasma wenyonii str. Massachusetts]
MLIRAGTYISKGSKKKKYKPVLFFNLIPNITFGIFIGIFLNLILLSGLLISLFTQNSGYQLFFYSALGFVTFLISFLIYKYKYFHILKVPSYKSFLIARNKLFWWIFWTVNAWMLSCWAGMVFIGVFKGFWWMHFQAKNLPVLTEVPELTKLTGIILWVIHWFLIGTLSISYKKFVAFFNGCRVKLRNRRIQLKQFKLKAEEEVNFQTVAI